tara:strand:- start:138 stop:707 length:570 start_codon:yes stop_codon:yes gene_type:complete
MNKKFFIEIGTSDFDTCEDLIKEGWKGIFVEPVKPLLDNIRNRTMGTECIYENTAITKEPMHTKVLFYDPEWAKGWVRGVGTLDMDMNTMNSNPQWKEHERHMYIKTITLDELIQTHNVHSIDFLKIDTEGTEYEILDSYSWKIKPEKIKFEYEHWINRDVPVKKYTDMLEGMGYTCTKDEHDVVAVLK